jgi:hypothetical protein
MNYSKENDMKQTPWSYSRLEAFELCPLKYFRLSVKRDIKDKPNEVAQYGTDAHKHFENRMMKGKPLPMDLQHHEKYILPIDKRPGQAYGEQKIALNADYEPTGFFDSDVWVRAIVDYTKIAPPAGLIVDWKFGKRRDGFDQVSLMAAMLFAYHPDLQGVAGAYYWAKEKSYARKVYKREDVPAIWASFLPRIERYQRAHAEADFPCRPNFLCRNYCPVTTCEHHGV